MLPLDTRRKARVVAGDANDLANKLMEQDKADMRQQAERLRAEAEQRLKAEEEERLQAEEEQRLQAEEEQRLKAAEQQRIKAEEQQRLQAEQHRLQAEKLQRRQAEEEQQQLQAEEHKRRQAQEDQRLQVEAEERQRLQAEKDHRLQADAEERQRLQAEAEEELRLQGQEQQRLQAQQQQHVEVMDSNDAARSVHVTSLQSMHEHDVGSSAEISAAVLYRCATLQCCKPHTAICLLERRRGNGRRDLCLPENHVHVLACSDGALKHAFGSEADSDSNDGLSKRNLSDRCQDAEKEPATSQSALALPLAATSSGRRGEPHLQSLSGAASRSDSARVKVGPDARMRIPPF